MIPLASSTEPPNILWIWADNLAYGDLGVYGNQEISTPNIDRLAANGVRLTQFYIAHPVCSPSRAALLTGRQPFRCGIVDVLRPDGPSGIPSDEITMGEILKEQGYATAAFGKWHLGDRREFLPLQHGFDHYFGLPYSMDMLPTLLYRDNEILERLDGDKVRNVTQRMVDDAIDFMESSREHPFFIYFSHTLPHPPINLPPEHRNPSRPIYYDAIEHLDRETGRLIDAMEKLGLRENTLIVFTSDNGPMLKDGSTGGLRGRIRESYEGGLRVPFVASFPGRIPSGEVITTPSIAYDLFPTFVKLASGELPGDRVYDGQDIWPLLTRSGTIKREKPFYWVYLDQVSAMRDGKWKLHLAHRDRALDTPELYDLEADPFETTSLTPQHPDVVTDLKEQAESFQTEIPKVWSLQYPVRDPAKRKSGVRRE